MSDDDTITGALLSGARGIGCALIILAVCLAPAGCTYLYALARHIQACR